MAVLVYQSSSPAGIALTLGAAAGGGDEIKPRKNGVVVVRNGDGTATVVTVVTPGLDKYGIARPDITLSVAAGATAVFGPFEADLGAVADKMVDLTYSKVTSLTVGAFVAG